MLKHSSDGSERGSKLPGFLTALTLGLLLSALPALAQAPQKAKPKTTYLKTATIENTGSTNTFGYKIVLTMTKGTYHVTVVSNGGKDSDAETGMPGDSFSEEQQLFSDLDKAMPLTALPVRHGMRSASFGTQTFITYKGQRSPDLTFVSDPRTVALKADIDNITKALHVGNAPRRPIVILHQYQPNEPTPNFQERF